MVLLPAVRARFWRLLLVTGIVAAGATAFAPVLPAVATNEGYSCSECDWVNGKENYLKNNEAANYSRKNVISVVWRKNGNGTYTRMVESYGSGYTTIACSSTEVYGHGEALSDTYECNEYGCVPVPAHLAGRQDNFSYCG
ncbi:MAG: hypothetical protein ACLPUT_02980 [Solirubrobacteraceae bacterium]